MATAFSLESFTKQAPLKRAKAIEKGLPARVLRDLVKDPAVTVAAVARVVAPRRTLDRRLKDNSALSVEESDRLSRFVDLLALATQVFGSRAEAMAWLSAPKHAFEGEVPLNLLKSDAGTRAVEEHLLRIRYGFFA
jgi:putative toxin-antitoxin system antitoxin component (TIGR02293 family)